MIFEKQVKIIIVSTINGEFKNFTEIFKKINEKSGKFDIVFLIGGVFNLQKDFKEWNLISVMFQSTKFFIFDDSEVGTVLKHKLSYDLYNLTDNITLIGRSGFILHENLRICFINGREEKRFISEKEDFKYTSCYFSRTDIDRILDENDKCNLKTDILLTNVIPFNFHEELLNCQTSLINTLKVDKNEVKERASLALNLIIKKIKPRYTLTCVEDFYYERTPYLNGDNFISRFINLAYFPSELKNNLKEKYLYACTLKPVNSMQHNELSDFTNIQYSLDPFKNIENDINSIFLSQIYHDKKIKISKQELYIGNLDRTLGYDDLHEFLSQFGEVESLNMIYEKKGRGMFAGHAFVKFKLVSIHDKLLKKSREISLRGRRVTIQEKIEKIVTQEDIEKECWFCYNSVNIDTDLIILEIKDFYIAYPKGPIDDFHFLVLPKKHIQSFLHLNDSQKSEFIEILKTLIGFTDDNNLDYVIFEKNLPYTNQAAKHMVINFVCIQKHFSFKMFDEIRKVIECNNLKYIDFNMKHSLSEIIDIDSFYYYIDYPSGIVIGSSKNRKKIIIHPIIENRNFIDFPRQIICNAIEKEERFNWKKVEINKDQLNTIKDKLIKYYNDTNKLR